MTNSRKHDTTTYNNMYFPQVRIAGSVLSAILFLGKKDYEPPRIMIVNTAIRQLFMTRKHVGFGINTSFEGLAPTSNTHARRPRPWLRLCSQIVYLNPPCLLCKSGLPVLISRCLRSCYALEIKQILYLIIACRSISGW